MSKRDSLLNKIERSGYPKNEVVVTLEDFFEGNNDYGSIGVNIYPNQPSPSDFYLKFKEIKQTGSVQNIYVRISDIVENEWPYTDAVYIITTLSKKDLKLLLSSLQPDDIYEGWMYNQPVNAPEIRSGHQVYSVWWD